MAATTLFLHRKPPPPPPFPLRPTHPHPRPHYHPLLPQFKTLAPPPLFSSSPNSTPPPPPSTECPVPQDQQPINEYQSLSTSFPFSWASGPVAQYSYRLVLLGLSFSVFVGLPVSWVGAVGSVPDPFTLGLGSVSGGLFVVTLAVVRMYLGWAYVGNRLLSATVEYEETGWYDGQIWVKTAEVLARDRLLGSFQVKPVLSRLKNTLVMLALSLFTCVALLMNIEGEQEKSYMLSNEAGGRAVTGAYNDDSARTFEPDAFHGEPIAPSFLVE